MSEAEIAQRATLGLVTAADDASDAYDEYDVSNSSSDDDGDDPPGDMDAEKPQRRSSVDVKTTIDRDSGSFGSADYPLLGGGDNTKIGKPERNRLSGCMEEEEEEEEGEDSSDGEREDTGAMADWENKDWKNSTRPDQEKAKKSKKSKISKLFGYSSSSAGK
jgi:hypothetical protein